MGRPGVTQHWEPRWPQHLWSQNTGASSHYMFPKLSLQLWFKGRWSCDLVQVCCWWLASTGWCQSLCCHMLTLNSLTLSILHLESFHPWSCMDVLADMSMGEHIASHWSTLEEVLLAWCRVGTRESALCGNSSFSLPSRVGSSRVKLVHLACAVHAHLHTVECPSLLQECNEKKSVMMEDLWSTLPDFHNVQRDIICDLTFDFIWHVLPSVFWFFFFPDMSLPSLRQDHQVPMKWY